MADLRANYAKFRYQQFYCEENIWHLCKEPQFRGLEKRVIFISNAERMCPLRYQRVCRPPERPVWWDYHVLLMCKQESWMVWDLDTLLGLPVFYGDYLKQTFGDPRAIPDSYKPRFRVVHVDEFSAKFSSDRSHMLTADGEWLAPPPVWSPIISGDRNTLDDFLMTSSDNTGVILTLEEVYKKFAN